MMSLARSRHRGNVLLGALRSGSEQIEERHQLGRRGDPNLAKGEIGTTHHVEGISIPCGLSR
jgi:hypothetical protein